ncbi:MAG: nitronate monooxygenase [Gaiellaceae bacterium]
MPASLRTPLCDSLGIEVPLLCAGMGSLAGPELAAAVSEAGGLGVLGISGASAETVRERLRLARELTDRPVGVNVIIELDEEDSLDVLSDQIRLAVEEGAAALVLFWGDPVPFVKVARATGPAKVLMQIGSVPEAEAAAEAGVDALVAQGLEAGGHVRGTTSIWELVPAVVAAVAPLPVLASGGIGDGAGLARALDLGAQGVSLGTLFAASEESGAHPAYKRRLVESTAEDTVYTDDLYDVWWPNAPHRTLRNRNFDEWEAAGRPSPGSRPGDGTSIGLMRLPTGETYEWPRYAIGSPLTGFEGEIDYAPMWAGESVSFVKEIKPAGEIVRELARDAAAQIRGSG